MAEQPICGFFRFGQALRQVGWFVTVDPAQISADPLATCDPYDWLLGDALFGGDCSAGGDLSEFELAILEEEIARVMGAPLSSLFAGESRIITEDEWVFGPTVGNA
jgi:hypothetical protein